jgi:uncharacterized delta-60 repeat protein
MSRSISAPTARSGSGARSTFIAEQLESRQLLSAGQLDPTFGIVGGALFSGGSASATALQANGQVIAAGNTPNPLTGVTQFALARFNADGSLDRSFGTNGRVITNLGGANQGILAVAVQKNGDIIAAGFFGTKDFALARYLPTGKLDKTFGSNGIETVAFSGAAQINAIAIQSDGKIDVAGTADNTLGSHRFTLARFTTAGKLDTSFGTNGIASTSFAGTGGQANALVIQTNGDLVVGGATDDGQGNTNFTLARYDTHGILDPTFGTQGIEIPAGITFASCNSLVLKSNGQIVAAGEGIDGALVVARFQTNGMLDGTFATDGVFTATFGGNIFALASVVIQKSGDIVAVGTETTFNGPNSIGAFLLTRLTPTGATDPGFGFQGVEEVTLPGRFSTASAAVLQPNDRILVAGGSIPGNQSDFALARFTLGGLLDTSFGFEGTVQQPNGITGAIEATLVQKDGKIIVAGSEVAPNAGPADTFATDAALARYNSDGSLDTTFGVNGRVFLHVGVNADFDSLAFDASGNIVAGGSVNVVPFDDFLVARFHSNGAPDSSFGTNGVVTTSFGMPQGQELSKIAIQSNGDIVAAGTTATAFVAVARYLPSGKLDTSFASGGKFLFSDNSTSTTANALAIQSDGKILVAGRFNTSFGVLRLLTGGKLDSSFGTGGVVMTDLTGTEISTATALLIDASGNILLGGMATLSSGPSNQAYALARYSRVDGKLDPTFGTGGQETLLLSGDIDDEIDSLAIQKNGEIIAGGISTQGFGSDASPGVRPFLFIATPVSAVLRFTAKGALDMTFGTNGVALPGNGAETGPVSSVSVLSNGDILGSAFDLFELKGS